MVNPFKGPGDEDLARLGASYPGPDSTDTPRDSSLVARKSGGLGSVARKTREDRRQSAEQEEPAPEPLEIPANDSTAVDSLKNASATLSNAKWNEPDTLFHQEAEVSVQVTLPKEKAHLTKIQVEMFAKTPSGPESIFKGEGHAQSDGTAVMTVPMYKPKGHQDGPVEYFLRFTHSLAKMLSGENQPRRVSETALKSIDHAVVPGIAFPADSSFISPKASQGLKALESKLKEWDAKDSQKAKISIFGHAGADEKDPKGLSERRAQSAFAFITNDADTWETLYQAEKWGLKALQSILKDLSLYPGVADGQDGPKTQAAFKTFQKHEGLPESGKEDGPTRKSLFAAYMKGKHDIKIDASRFRKVAGSPWMGCGTHNSATSGGDAGIGNRRTTFILLRESKYFPVHFPCQDRNESACQAQCKKPGKRSTAGIKCLFYDELVREKHQEIESPESAPPAAPKNDSNDDVFISADDAMNIVAAARNWVGTPYVTGGNNKDGADCSGSVCGIFKDAGIPFPRVSSFDFPTLKEFKKAPGNKPQIGDIGYWPGHLMIFEPNAGTTSKGEIANGWSATHPDGKPFGVARYQWFDSHYSVPVVWYRYLKKDR
jgi:outer membrane protein OmpA-like peptidoglycan-associated protein